MCKNELEIITPHRNMMMINWENICTFIEHYLSSNKLYINNSYHYFHIFENTKENNYNLGKISTVCKCLPYSRMGTIDC